MNVSAVDKSGGKSHNITIKNDKGRLSQEEIEKLIKEAEEMKGQDDIVRQRIDAKNALENLTYNIKNTLKDDKYKDKFSSDERSKIEKIVEETVKWIEGNQEAEKEEFAKK